MWKGPIYLDRVTEMMRTFTAAYQLLLIYPCYDAGDGRLLRVGETHGIPHVDAAKAANALRFHREIEEAVNQHLKQTAYLEQRYHAHFIAGIHQKTAQVVRLANGSGEIEFAYQGRDASGDRTVPRVSATPIEYSNQGIEVFAATKYASLQNADAVITQLFGIISGQSIDLGGFRKPRPSTSVEVEDLYLEDETDMVKALPSTAAPEFTATVRERNSGTAMEQKPLLQRDELWHSAKFGPLPQGFYVVEASASEFEGAADAFTFVKREGEGRV